MDGMKNDAEALRLGLLAGMVDRSEIVAWADERVATDRAAEAPALLDLSLGAEKSVADLVSLLGALPGASDTGNVGRRLARQIYRALRDRRVGIEHAARAMYRVMREGYAPDREFETMAYVADDGVDLARSGTYGTLDELSGEVLAFLRRYDNGTGDPLSSAS